MKECKVCKTLSEDSTKYCYICGTKFDDVPSFNANEKNNELVSNELNPKSSKNGIDSTKQENILVDLFSLTCTKCGNPLNVNINDGTAICQNCGAKYYIERRNNSAQERSAGIFERKNANDSGEIRIENLLIRAQGFLDEMKYSKADEYYNRILDMDPFNAQAKEGLKKIEELTNVEVGAIYEGKVSKIMNFGCFVLIYPSMKEGLIHISKLTDQRNLYVSDIVSVGDSIVVKVIEIDDQGRLNLVPVK